MVISRCDVGNRAKREALVDERLDEMGFVEMEDGPEIRAAAKTYYLELLQEHLDNADDLVFTEYFDNSEGIVWGFVAGYVAYLKAHRPALQS